MNERNSFKNRFKDWLSELGSEQQEEAEMLWNRAEETDESQDISVSDSEKERVFAEIASRTGLNTKKSAAPASSIDSSHTHSTWKWVAAAAVIILAAGLGYLTIPINISVPHGETASITLRDGSQLTLNSGSTITYSRLYGYLEREITLEGEAYFKVQKGDHPFAVHTSNATVTVLGTAFNLRSWQEDTGYETTVTLQEGSLAFYASGQPDKSVVLNPGERSTVIAESEAPTSPESIDIDRSMAWMENRFAFEDRTLLQIIREIERRFDISIAVQSQQVLDDTLTIYYNNAVGAEQIIRDICQSKALNYREVNGGYLIE